MPYRVESTPFRARDAGHSAHQPFGQVPWLTDGDLSVFESGAILLHLANRSDALLPSDPLRRAEALQWLFAALNSVEMASLPWSMSAFSGDTGDTPGWKRLDDFSKARLDRLEPVLAGREWLAGTFSIADILMADVLRLVDRFDGMARHGPPVLRQGARRPDGAFRRGGLSGTVPPGGAGHWTQQERPAEVTAALLEFLRGLPAFA